MKWGKDEGIEGGKDELKEKVTEERYIERAWFWNKNKETKDCRNAKHTD